MIISTFEGHDCVVMLTQAFQTFFHDSNFAVPLPDAIPASPLSQMQMTAGGPPPKNDIDFSLRVVSPARLLSKHLESAVKALGMYFSCVLSLS